MNEVSDMQAFLWAFGKLNYQQFCEVIGEPYRDGNYYAEEKWQFFKDAARNIERLGLGLANKLVEAGRIPGDY